MFTRGNVFAANSFFERIAVGIDRPNGIKFDKYAGFAAEARNGFNRGRDPFVAADWRPPNENPDRIADGADWVKTYHG